MSKPVILLAIDEREEREALATQLGAANIACQCVDQPAALMAELGKTQPATVIVDISFGGRNAHHMLHSSALKLNGTPVVFRARRSASELELALEASLKGAGDFLLAPHDQQRLGQIIERAHSYFQKQLTSTCHEPSAPLGPDSDEMVNLDQYLVGSSEVIAKIRAKVREVAASRTHLLIHGEAGTGKQRIAKAIHQLSPWRQGPWITVDPASIPQGEAEKHLFGSRISQLGGDWEVCPGKFDIAAGGTLYIDELGDLEWGSQLSLLRKLERQSMASDDGSDGKEDVRVIAATSLDPAQLMASGRLREDLYVYLSGNAILLPPLRERVEDIAPIATHFLENTSEVDGRRVQGFSDGAASALGEFNWPGNLDQLRAVVEQLVLATEGPLVETDALRVELGSGRGGRPLGQSKVASDSSSPSRGVDSPTDLTPLQRQERLLIIEALAQTDDNVVDAARLLKMGQATVYRKIRFYQISHARRRRKPRLSPPRLNPADL